MKTMTVFEARNNFSRTLDAARKDVVVVTRNGKPVATIRGIDDADMEDLLLERSEKFWTMIARARAGKAVSLATVRRQAGQTWDGAPPPVPGHLSDRGLVRGSLHERTPRARAADTQRIMVAAGGTAHRASSRPT